jgi:acyl-CoA hydrolase
MKFYTRKWVRPEDLNSRGTLFGGSLLKWIDEEAAIYVSCQLETKDIVTKYMSEIDFVSSARLGDIVEMGMEAIAFGTSSITVRCVVRKKSDKQPIITIDKIVFVRVDANGRPTPHGKTSPMDIDDE